MAFTEPENYNEDNHKQYFKFLNKIIGVGINYDDIIETTMFLEAIITPAFSDIYNNSKIARESNFTIKNYDVNEFKGDSIIGYIVVMNFIKNENVGKMDLRKQSLVSNKRLSKIYDELSLDDYVYTQKNKTESLLPEKVKADIIEALVYAIHVKSSKLSLIFLEKYLNKNEIMDDLKNRL